MKFQLISLAVAGLALAACGGPEAETDSAPQTAPTDQEASPAESAAEKEQAADTAASANLDIEALRDDCDTLAGDPEAQESFADIGSDAEAFCGCFVTMVEEKPEAERADILMTLGRVTDGMSQDNEGAEEVVGRIMSETMIMGDTEEARTLRSGVELIGDIIDDVEDRLEDGGSCPAG